MTEFSLWPTQVKWRERFTDCRPGLSSDLTVWPHFFNCTTGQGLNLYMGEVVCVTHRRTTPPGSIPQRAAAG